MSLREQFEAFCSQRNFVEPFYAFRRKTLTPDEYANTMVQAEWEAFQAGHAANTVNADLLDELEYLVKLVKYHGLPEGDYSDAVAAIKKARGE